MAPIRVIGRKQRLFDLLTSEEGNADRGKALAAGAVLGGSVLAQMLLAPSAGAHQSCGGTQTPCNMVNEQICLAREDGAGHACIPRCDGSVLSCDHQL
jgi:hypothetical protein